MSTQELTSENIQRHRRRGATIVEFALTFMLFFVMVLALMELGRGMWTYATIAHASRQAGRYCMIRGSENPTTLTAIREVVEKHCSGLNTSALTISCAWRSPVEDVSTADPADVERGDIVEVRVSYPFHLVAGGLILAGNTIQMGATTRMVVAN